MKLRKIYEALDNLKEVVEDTLQIDHEIQQQFIELERKIESLKEKRTYRFIGEKISGEKA